MSESGTPTVELPPNSEEHEAHQYWGYLFKADRTGTDKLKNLLRGLHSIISTTFDPYDSTDITPSQLAKFYRSLNGDYDPLFLSTPPAAIAFIYKHLGCIHSLQPIPGTKSSDHFSDPVVPALKVQGWVVWQTIQLLLGPEEHSGFLKMAVQKWDIRDPETGNFFPKILPRSCFPAEPDARMVHWYEGVSERLRHEAEEEEKMRITAGQEHRSDTPNSASHRHQKRIEKQSSTDSGAEDSGADSKSSALAYFRNPLFRASDGRPGVVRRASRRPGMGDRGSSFMSRSKSVASSVSNVVKNVGSPHLWDGHASKEKERDKDRQRRNTGEKSRYKDDETGSQRDSSVGLHPRFHEKQRRRDSLAVESPPNGQNDASSHGKHSRHDSNNSRYYSDSSHQRRDKNDSREHERYNDRDRERHKSSHHERDREDGPRRNGSTKSRNHDNKDASTTSRNRDTRERRDESSNSQRKSHEEQEQSYPRPPPPREYFPPYEDMQKRRGSSDMSGLLRSDSPNQAGFMPSQSPLFATHVARGDVPAPYQQQSYQQQARARPSEQRKYENRSPEKEGYARRAERDEKRENGRHSGKEEKDSSGSDGRDKRKQKTRFDDGGSGSRR